jgi:hypothetical protein
MRVSWTNVPFLNRWRPVTAIQAGDTDGNATDPDPSWLPLVPTPTHPEYPAAHGCVTTAFAETIADFMGTKNVTITLTSLTSPNRPSHTFFRTDDMVHAIVDARIYGGMHFRTSGQRGVVIGRKVAHWVSKHYFRPRDGQERRQRREGQEASARGPSERERGWGAASIRK